MFTATTHSKTFLWLIKRSKFDFALSWIQTKVKEKSNREELNNSGSHKKDSLKGVGYKRWDIEAVDDFLYTFLAMSFRILNVGIWLCVSI